MPALVRDDPAAQRPPDQIQIADDVQHLVPGTFVGEAKLIIDRARRRDHQHILRRQMLTRSPAPHLPRFMLERKRPRRGKLRDKIIIADMKREICRPTGAGPSNS